MIFLDVETSNILPDYGSWDMKAMKISYAGVIDSNNQSYDIWEKDMEALRALMNNADLIVGYNIFHFDMPVIANYLGEDIHKLPQLDLMVAAQKALGFRPKLDSLTSATFGEGKIGNGGDAVKYFHSGQLDKLREYCLEDVRLTKKLYDFGKEKGYIKFYDKSGFAREIKINWDDGLKQPVQDAGIISMF